MRVKEAETKLFTLLPHSTPSRTRPPPGGCCLLFCFILVTLLGMQDLSSWTRDQTCFPEVEIQNLNHCGAGKGRPPLVG